MTNVDDAEFDELAESIIEQLTPRVPSQYSTGLGYYLEAGEYWMAVENLVILLSDCQVPVTAEERDTLYELVSDMENNDLVVKLATVIVNDASTGHQSDAHKPQ